MSKPEPHQVLARKHRPQSLDALVGQPGVSQTLKNALAAKRLHHAYLFTGPRGCGKTTTARILAKALNCAKGPTPEPCGECVPCREIAASSSLDVLELDAASHTGVDNVREVIVETVGLAPARDRYKVFIIDETHMLSPAAFNALLKTIEEPPPHAVFILATTEAHKVPATIASRCQRFKFRPVPADQIAAHLDALARKEGIAVEPEALALLARAAEGSLRDAVSLLDQCRSGGEGKVALESVREAFGFAPRELLLGAAKALLGGDARALAGWLKKTYEEGVDPAQFLKDLRTGLEACYLAALGSGEPLEDAWKQAAGGASAEALGFLLRRLNRALEELRYGDSPRLSLELGLFSALESAQDLGAWVERLEALERRLSAGGGGPVRPVRESASAPAASSAPPARPSSAGLPSWTAFVAEAAKEKPTLGAALERAAGEPEGADAFAIRFARPFDLDSGKRAQDFLAGLMSRLAGRPVALRLALGGTDAKKGADAAAPAGEPVSGAFGAAESVFGGKARVVKSGP